MNHKDTALRRLKAARTALVLNHPFFGHLALGMALRPETRGRTRTMGTDGSSVYYEESFVNETSDADLITTYAHEVMHPALLHHTRRGDRDLTRWNDAGDYVINWLLKQAGFQIPMGWLIDAQFKGMTAEQVYDALQQAAKEPMSEDSLTDAGGKTDQAGNGTDSLSNSNDPGGDSTNSDSRPSERPGAVWDSPEPAHQEVEWQIMLKQACQLAQMMGHMPAGIACAVEAATLPRVDWRAVLRRFVQQFCSADYSWRRPNRRYIAHGLCLPELRADAMPGLVVVVDTSASTRRVLPVFKAELQSIVDDCQPEWTIVMMSDAAVHRVDRFERGEPIEFNVEGLGGTDFRPSFEYVQQYQLSPAGLIYLTDGEGIFPDEPTEYPTLWAITTPDLQVPWGETVMIDTLAA